jgi:hypothetical protein
MPDFTSINAAQAPSAERCKLFPTRHLAPLAVLANSRALVTLIGDPNHSVMVTHTP